MEIGLDRWEPLCFINGKPATARAVLPVATGNLGHITIMQTRAGKVRGFRHHLDRLEAANAELFGRLIDRAEVADLVRQAVESRPDATLRINIFAGDAAEHVMITLTPPAEHDSSPARFSLVSFERDMPHLKHTGSFGLSLRQRQAVAAGYDGAVFTDRHGTISEATIWNVGFYDGRKIVWPDTPHLRGITQTIINNGLTAMDVPVCVEPIAAGMLGRYRSSFITNSSTMGRPLAMIGTHRFVLDGELDELLLRAYEKTPFEAPSP